MKISIEMIGKGAVVTVGENPVFSPFIGKHLFTDHKELLDFIKAIMGHAVRELVITEY